MKLLPDSPSSKCGLLNYLTIVNRTHKSLFIPENCHGGVFLGQIQSIANCKVDSGWPSSDEDPSITFQLYSYHIRPLYVSLTRRGDYAYPRNAVLQGLEYNGWVNICSIHNIEIGISSTKVFECIPATSNSYSSLRFLEIKTENSGLRYLELHSFDLFGYMLYDFATISEHFTFKHSYFLIFILSTKQ